MTILRIDLGAGGWRAVPPQIFEDERLSLDTRCVAGFIATRSDSFSLSVGGLCKLLKIGEDKWKRMSAELKEAGYLRHIVSRNKAGRFQHELWFSPIPEGGFPEKQTTQSTVRTRKSPTQPAPANPGSAEPSAASNGSTRDPGDHISDHHRSHGGGAPESTESKPPPLWIEAANHEISIEQLKRPIKNHEGLLNKILARYRANRGPGNLVISELEAKKATDAIREARTEAERARAKTAQELSRANELRHSAAEANAKSMDRQDRIKLLAITQKTVRLKAAKRAEAAFVDYGEIMHGQLCHALTAALISP